MLEFAQEVVFMATYCLEYITDKAWSIAQTQPLAPKENLLFGFFS